MKKLRNWNFSLFYLLFGVLSPSLALSQEDPFVRAFHREFEVSADVQVSLESQYGKMKVITTSDNKVTIDVKARYIGKKEDKAQQVLDAINVDFSGSPKAVSATTEIGDMPRNGAQYKVDYVVHMPATGGLNAELSFGDLVVGDVSGKSRVTMSYGSISAGSLSHPENYLYLGFSKGSVSALGGGTVKLRYTELSLDELGDGEVDSQFSALKVKKAGELDMKSQYDTYDIKSCQSLDGGCQFTTLEVETLHQGMDVRTQYGSVRVERIDAASPSIEVESQFTNVRLGFAKETSFVLAADISMDRLKYPDDMPITVDGKRVTSFKYAGTIGTGTGRVDLEAAYGSTVLSWD